MAQKQTHWLLDSDTSSAAVPILCAFLLTAETVFSQKNLVPNGGFDSLEICPGNFGQIVLAEPWKNAQGTPDLFHECSSAPDYQVPFPFLCQNLPAQNGEGYAGIAVYGTREFIETNLLEPLTGGKPYYVRFFVAADKECQGGLPQSFSDAIALQLKRANDPTGNFETILENSGTLIKETVNWVKISDCYYARGSERELHIGNPKTDAESLYETDQPDYPYPENYMFVDDVFIGTFDPFPDTLLLCEGVPTVLDATFLESEYQWNTGATEAVLITSDTGRFVVQAVIDGCIFRDTVQVISLPPTPSTTLNDTTLCDGESLVLTAPIPGEYLWSNGSTAPQIVVKNPGEYSVTVTNECGEFHFSQKVVAENCRCRVFVPNIFSPNDDGFNDFLEISIGCEHEFTVERFEIFDRWGGQVFASKNYPLAAWDGTWNGKKAMPGVYVWRLTYSLNRNASVRKFTEQGDVTLLR
jgi:gliding motility-associated-like protein